MKIAITEAPACLNMQPLNMLRGQFNIKYGALSAVQILKHFITGKDEIILYCRKELESYIKYLYPKTKVNSADEQPDIYLSADVKISKQFWDTIKKADKGIFTINGNFAAAKGIQINTTDIYEIIPALMSSSVTHTHLKDIVQISRPWHIIENLHMLLEYDLELITKKLKPVKLTKVEAVNKKNVYLSVKALVSPGVVLDASEGKIVISEEAKIEPFVFIKGPAYIAQGALVKSGAKIYGPTVIGEYSKVSGEIGESIFHSYVNKQHDGFVGHSYICPYVNLGADTVTSDLKNNYSNIKIKCAEGDIDTGIKFLGSILGDHTKTSINTMLNTGTGAGIFANIFGGGFPQKAINSFSWNETGKPALKYELDKALKTAEIVMNRRGIEMSSEYKDLVMFYYNALIK